MSYPVATALSTKGSGICKAKDLDYFIIFFIFYYYIILRRVWWLFAGNQTELQSRSRLETEHFALKQV